MNAAELHELALRLHGAGQNDEALQVLRDILGDNSTVWSDWATIQFRRGEREEAEAGYRMSLRLNADDAQVAANLGALLADRQRFAEAIPYLEKGLEKAEAGERVAIGQLWNISREQTKAKAGTEDRALEAFLREYLSADANEQSYFETHVHRYVATLQALPESGEPQRVLELGSAFFHLTAALKHCKHYNEVRCTDVWDGDLKKEKVLHSRSGRFTDTFEVDNFDLQSQPWPYADDEFDGVLCCEILEHLHQDPMALLEEINRVLKKGGFLFLSTPNLGSAHAVEQSLEGGSPYCYGKFEVGGQATDRHNREYTAQEVERLAKAGGFEIVSLRTQDFYWPPKKETIALLGRGGHPLKLRGDSTFLLARKSQPVRNRYPEEFYALQGLQTARRENEVRATAGAGAAAILTGAEAPARVLLVHEIVPHHDCSGADLRLYELVRELQGQGHQVTLLARQDRDQEKYAPGLLAMGAKVIAGDPERLKHVGEDQLTAWSFSELLEEGNFDIAILSYWYWNQISVAEHYLDEIRRWSPKTCVMVLSEDRHGERERRSFHLSGLFSDNERGEDFEQREAEVYRRADIVLYVSEVDQRHFRKLLPELRTEHLPTLADLSVKGPSAPNRSYQEREGILFLGNFENLANRDALDWLLGEVLPLLAREEPDLKLYVAGHGLTKELCPPKKNVVAIGKIAELAPAFAERRVFVGPIRFGTGIITKNMMAMASGLPVVTTKVGAEGLQLTDGQNALIADEPQAFAKAVLKLYRDESLWNEISEGGRKYIESNFTVQNLRRQLKKIVQMAPALDRQPYEQSHQWSYRKVETHLPQVLTQHPAHYRTQLRHLGYWQLGHQLLVGKQYAAALEQFRHVFTTLRGEIPGVLLHGRLLSEMAECYQALGNREAAARCQAEVNKITKLNAAWEPGSAAGAKTARDGGSTPELSVIIPTFNRRDKLLLCLAALSLQTLPAKFWEVIVVDDGSNDGTGEMLERYRFPFGEVRYVRQKNQGAGAARRAGVAAARGTIVLLLNDDSIATPKLLAEHLAVHRRNPKEKWAILGSFLPSPDADRHVLSMWIQRTTFLFPQNALQPGQTCGANYFITCNLSVSRSAVQEAGSFDPEFRVGEDTELGTRLEARGYRVKYYPAAAAWHEHPGFTTEDLLARAATYGPVHAALFRKHPQLLRDGKTPFGKLSEADYRRMQSTVNDQRRAVEQAIVAMKALDGVDLFELARRKQVSNAQVQDWLRKVAQLVPMVYWSALFESFLKASGRSESPRLQPVRAEVAGALP